MNNSYHLIKDVLAAQNIVDTSSRTLFLNGLRDDIFEIDNLYIHQPFKPYSHQENLEDINGLYDLIMIIGTKHVKETQYYISLGLQHLNKDGHLIIAADNKENGKRLDKWLKEAGSETQSFSGNKAKCILVKKDGDYKPEKLKEWQKAGEIQKNQDGFYAQPGLFSWNKIDPASKLLIETIDEPLKGHIADFGCGYGFLSHSAKSEYEGIKSLCGYDADKRALICYKKNIPVSDICEVTTHWIDLGKVYDSKHKYDFILMNPPFHEGRKDTSALGEQFIKNASRSLKRKGILWMVANRHLPYEKILKEEFFNFEKKAETNNYKVFRATK